MADLNLTKFDRRVGRISKRHRKIAKQGFVTAVNRDGLITTRVRSRAPRFPWRGIAVVLALLFVFKSLVLIQLGEAAYAQRVAKLQAGTVIEQAGAYVMHADPVTNWMAAKIGKFVK